MDKETQTLSKAKQKERAGANESPFEEGSCLCGIPNCSGHEVIDGKIEIPEHLFGYLRSDLQAIADSKKKK